MIRDPKSRRNEQTDSTSGGAAHFWQWSGGFRPVSVTIQGGNLAALRGQVRLGGFNSGAAVVNPELSILDAKTRGDAAVGSLLEGYRNYLRLLARLEIGRRLQGKVDASDLVQETFLEAHRNFHRFQGTSEPQFACWLRQILAANVANLVRRYFGTQGRDARLEEALAAELDNSSRMLGVELAASLTSPSQQAVHREEAVLLADALDALPTAYREVIILRHLEGLTFPEVARRMERTEDSVEKLWVRALARLRGALGDLQ